MMARLETMILMGIELPLMAIRRQLASGIDIIVHLGRLRDKSRRVMEITEVRGVAEGEVRLCPIFRFEEKGEIAGKINGSLERVGRLENVDKWLRGGMKLEEDKV